MEGELWKALYRLLGQEAKRRNRPRGVIYSDRFILAVYLWSVLHDRPRCWACRIENWPATMRWLTLPSQATLSRRLPSLSVQLLLAMLYEHLAAMSAPTLVRAVDSKPLPVGGFSKDRDARRGYGAGQIMRGYKLFCVWGRSALLPEALTIGPMNLADPTAAAMLITRLPTGGYLLADVTHDSNPLHAIAASMGLQLLAPRKCPGTALGHCPHHPARLRSIELLESGSTFGRTLYAQRGAIERDFGQAGNFGGGLQPLPNWVRHPRRVALWVIGKLLFNALRLQRLAA